MTPDRAGRDGASTRARLIAGVGAAVAAASLLLAACGPSHAAASSGASRPSVSAPVSTPALTPTPRGGVTAQPTLAVTAPASCAQFAAQTFLHLLSATNEADGSLAVTANLATVVCGGPDDLHYTIGTNTVTAHVVPNASVTIFSLATMQSSGIAPSQLPGYLPTDGGTRIFLVSGPLSAITSLAEQYHP